MPTLQFCVCEKVNALLLQAMTVHKHLVCIFTARQRSDEGYVFHLVYLSTGVPVQDRGPGPPIWVVAPAPPPTTLVYFFTLLP